MPSPDEVHEPTLERNIPRGWIALTQEQYNVMKNKGNQGINLIPGAINMLYFNKALISTSPFVVVATWFDLCKLRGLKIPNKLTLVSWVEDIKEQRLRSGDKVINIFNRGPISPQLHLENNKSLRFTPRALITNLLGAGTQR